MIYGNPPKPVTIRGITYPSHSEAARKLGLHRSTIYYAVMTGGLDRVGHNHVGRPPNRRRKKEVRT